MPGNLCDVYVIELKGQCHEIFDPRLNSRKSFEIVGFNINSLTETVEADFGDFRI
jgi:hypothetical protein